MTKYEWRIKSLAKGVDPDLAIKELERIENVYGSLTAENVLNASREPDAVLHRLFEWDNTKAAENFRLQQARNLINNIEVKVIKSGVEQKIPVFEIVTLTDGRAYKAIHNMDSSDIEFVRKTTRHQIQHLKSKLSAYNELEKTVRHLDDALQSL